MYSKMQGRAGRRGNGRWLVDAVARDDDDLAVLDLAHELGADDVEGARLGGQHPRLAEAAEHQRPDTDGITRADHHVVGDAGERVGAFDLQQRIHEALDDAALLGAGDQMEDDLGVRGRLTDGARLDQIGANREGIRQVAVVRHGETALVEIGKQRLDIAKHDVAGGRIAVVAEGDATLQAGDHVSLVEVVADEAEAALLVEARAVIGDDAAAFLAAMLERVQAERRQRGRILVAEDAEHAAFLAQPVVAVAA